jgi:hypothetical protein
MGSPRRSGLDYFLVTEIPARAGIARGHAGSKTAGTNTQPSSTAFAEQGVIVLGGPVGDPDFGPALLVFSAENDDAVQTHLSEDPWFNTVLEVENVQSWSIWIGSLAR